jgi:hypothetical protein
VGFAKRNPNPDGDITGMHDQEIFLKQLVRNVTLKPSKRLKALIRYMWMFATGNKKKILQIILYGYDNSVILDRDDGTIKKVKYPKTMLRYIIKDKNLSAEKKNLAFYLLSWISSTGKMEEFTRRDLLECRDARLKNGLDTNWEDDIDTSTNDVLRIVESIERGNAVVQG